MIIREALHLLNTQNTKKDSCPEGDEQATPPAPLPTPTITGLPAINHSSEHRWEVTTEKNQED